MALRLLNLLLCVLLVGPISTSARAVAGPKTRVGGSPGFSSVFASEVISQVAEPHRENLPCGYDFASGVCKYLYAHADPVNMLDPSGHEGIVSFVANFAIRAGLYTLTGAAIGGAARGGDALIDGRPIWQETIAGAKWGAAVGFSASFRFLRPVIGVAGAALGGYSTGHALSEEKYGLALYRGVLTAGGIYGYYYFSTPKGSINVTTGIRGSRGTIYFGGYDPKAKSVYLGDDGHFGGMKGAGGEPVPSQTPGITVLQTAGGVQWANDSLSLPKSLAADKAAAVQAILESFFSGQSVKQVPVIK